ncbi:hypothetical protein JN531_004290 [Flagellatimonas centrodinii]|uniref:alpha/beta hydrolase domain-containing protein n=1 Tax=Flagellatimonas centrodinii TaxID=2806210 RepID=UPI001FEE4A54|nr:alpha/beta hydrolase domain-containing protein [Flagellatimonas centrodinii]ULQ47506.1 hypothetical protein JN531_004290 [Flagellatimonas centrodinii]
MAHAWWRGGMAVVLLGLSACGGDGLQADLGGTTAAARVSGPIEGGLRGHALWDSWFRLEDLGYTEAEYFIRGTATSKVDGSTQPYTTRFILRRPLDPARFNGTVVLDWVNVSAQFENAVDTLNSQAYFLREGYAYAHVSVQAAGLCCLPLLTPKLWDPVRYGPLDHPGDDFAFSMLNQVARAIRAPDEIDPMDGLPVQTVLAAGQSQSANQLFEFVSEGHIDPQQIDGVLVHSSIGRVFTAPPPVPVLHLLSDYEARPEGPATDTNVVLWEVAGSAHQDFHVGYQQVFGQGLRAEADLPQRSGEAYARQLEVAGNYGEQPHPLHAACIVAGAAFPMRYAVNAAFDHLNRWARGGARPPAAPRYQFNEDGSLAADRFGNALGGIRLPPVVVPVARYRSTVCGLGGITLPFTSAELGQEYASHGDYLCALRAATAQSVADGFLLPADADDLIGRAVAAANRFAASGPTDCHPDG